MITLLICLVIGFSLLTVAWMVRIKYVDRRLRQLRHTPPASKSDIRIRLLLPVLNEDSRLPEFVAYFNDRLTPKNPHLTLTIITTQKEITEYPQSQTISIAEESAKAHAAISHVHYPRATGTMAHQLNYALQDIADDDLIAIYNADSVPEVETFDWIVNNVQSGKNQVFQQYGAYTKNYKYIANRPGWLILIYAMYWQCRWSVGFELYRALAAQSRAGLHWSLRPFNYCIGHGLFIKARLIKDIKFSESTTNEDAILGIELARRGIDIIPVPYFDLAESPDTLRSIYRQKIVWFQGPFQAFLYYKRLRNRGHKARLLVSCVKLFTHAVYWTFGPTLLVTNIVLAVILCQQSLVWLLALIPPLLFLAAPAAYGMNIIGKQNAALATRLTGKVMLSLVFGATVAYVVHGLAGYRGVTMTRQLLRGRKPKTIMAQHGELK